MSRGFPSTQQSAIDSPLRRLPVVLFSAFMIWGVLLWGFGLLLGQMSGQSLLSEPITAQIIEITPPVKQAPVPIPVRPKPMPKSIPQPQRSIQQPLKQPSAPVQLPPKLPSQIQPVTKPMAQSPAASTPVSLPETGLPAGKKASSEAIPDYKTNGKISSGTSNAPVTPPQFGAAYFNNPKPAYPPLAKRMGMEGMVMLKVLVSREGDTLNIEIARSSGYHVLDKAATEAVKKWRFIPARQGDYPLEAWVQVPMVFNLKK